MDRKKEIKTTGTLLRPIRVGQSAKVLEGEMLRETSLVVSIISLEESVVRFETENTLYTIIIDHEESARKRELIRYCHQLLEVS